MYNEKVKSRRELTDAILKSTAQDFVNGIHQSADQKDVRSDIYTYIQNLDYSVRSVENTRRTQILKQKKDLEKRNRILEQLINEIELQEEKIKHNALLEQIRQLKLAPTANANFMVDDSGVYYRLHEYEYVADKSVVDVDSEGNYKLKSKIKNFSGILITTYDIHDKVMSIKILNNNEEVYKSEKYVAKKLNMKQEFVNKYKLRGYSGNSSGLFESIANCFVKPVPSGCYFSGNYHFFKWNNEHCQFEIQYREGNSVGSPMLADYDIKEDIVVRTDYDGAGMYM